MKNIMNWFMKEESGQGMVEYGLILALISVAVIAALTLVGGKLNEIFGKISTKLQEATQNRR
ncbi:Flp family type IVb pilin [Helcococcus ovis]|uniref:Flp family type IVb pilin n=1 Tax=Helcococcus ovis TaxID=72026 RepID=UPI00106F0E0C|nr:Flp family type IVb pilin [Helcococcus ovis]TFF65513.1 Flp family type IVb pilin [Helcococcus ovis]WNZ00778.1 Flp family type IVb pilin [Helcococcus ovis]